MFIKGRKRSSYNLARPGATDTSNILTNIIQKTSSRSSSKNFDLDLEGQSASQSKNVVAIDTDAFKNLVIDETKVDYLIFQNHQFNVF